MDNFTHSLAGWALGQTGLKRLSRKGLAALVLGANAPDIDVFFGWVPWEPLATHRGVTHSLVGGVLVLPAMLAILLWLLDRWQVKRGSTFKSGLEMHFGWLVALSYLGCLTHPLLDWQNTYAVQLLSPFSNLWFHNDALFIIDVWIWSGLAFAIWLSRRREKAEGLRWRLPPVIALAGMVAYICGNGVLSALAREAPTNYAPYARPDTIVAGPPPVVFWRRDVIWRQEGAIARGDYDPFRSLFYLQSHTEPMKDGMADPVARRALHRPEIASFARWSLFPMAWVTPERCSYLVRFQDARFGMRPGMGRLGTQVRVPREDAAC